MKYDETFSPPAPVATISLRNIATGERIENLPALLDTGADVSLLPFSAIENLKIEPSGEKVALLGFVASRSISETYALQEFFSGEKLRANIARLMTKQEF